MISVIDIQKNGNAKINTRAREAIRFLEQYSIKPNKYLKIQKNEERRTVDYEEFYIFKDQEENDKIIKVEEDNDASNDSNSEEVKNIFENTEINNDNAQSWNKNKENELNDEMTESITYYRSQKPSRKYRSLIECINYYNETAKNEIAHITSIDNNMEDKNENIWPLILVTNSRILLKYCEMYQIDCKCMSLQEFIKFMAVKRQEKRKKQ